MPLAIANEFLTRWGRELIPAQMWLQKLVYMAHGWNLAVNGEPLVRESPEAWDNGPVFRSIWDHIKSCGYVRGRLFSTDGKQAIAESLEDSEKAVIDHVWRKYGEKSGSDLSAMTHQSGTPWTDTYLTRGRNASIPDSLIRRHYIDLAMAGRAGS